MDSSYIRFELNDLIFFGVNMLCPLVVLCCISTFWNTVEFRFACLFFPHFFHSHKYLFLRAHRLYVFDKDTRVFSKNIDINVVSFPSSA